MGLMDKAKDALNSDKGKEATSQGLDKAEDFAKDKLGEDKSDQISDVRGKVEDRLGTGNDDNKGEDEK
ncbi:antitoxin [Corynebacterium confusum]